MGRINETKDYKRFELLDFNRQVKKKKKTYRELKQSMYQNGWLDSCPMMVVKNGKNGKLKIKSGHHRFECARELGIPVKYVFDNTGISVHQMELGTGHWSLQDYLDSYVRSGLKEYVKVSEYCEETGIGLSAAVSILNGEISLSGNRVRAFKAGEFKVKPNNAYARNVAEVISHLRECGISWATDKLLVGAVMRIVAVPELDMQRLKQKTKQNIVLFDKQPTKAAYEEMLEMIYNTKARSRVPLAFLAAENARKRRIIKK